MLKSFAVLALAAAPALFAQTQDMSSASAYARTLQTMLKTNIVRAAEKMPEENYSFKPTPDIRSFGELIGHIANAEYNMCSGAMGEKNPNTVNIEKTKTSKADLVAALNASFDYCGKAYATLSDAKVGEMAKYGNSERNKLGLLNYNNFHSNEHYGNIVTYMRLKNLVPPTSEPK